MLIMHLLVMPTANINLVYHFLNIMCIVFGIEV